MGIKLEAFFSRPLRAMKEFSTSLQEYAGKNKNFLGFEEAGAILLDVYDNIMQVKQMVEGFSESCTNEYRKGLLSPAKRSLLFVDPTLDYALMLYDDSLILLEFFFINLLFLFSLFFKK